MTDDISHATDVSIVYRITTDVSHDGRATGLSAHFHPAIGLLILEHLGTPHIICITCLIKYQTTINISSLCNNYCLTRSYTLYW